MCGIFSVSCIDSGSSTKQLVESLLYSSLPRGRHATGLIVITDTDRDMLALPQPADIYLKDKRYKNFSNKNFKNDVQKKTILGHCRLSTGATEFLPKNNLPLVSESLSIVHNGIVTNSEKINIDFGFDLRGISDTHTILALIEKYKRDGDSIFQALKKSMSLMLGGQAFVLYDFDTAQTFAYTNFGSLYYHYDSQKSFFVTASERSILEKSIGRNSNIVRIHPGQLVTFDLKLNSLNNMPLNFKRSSSTNVGMTLESQQKRPIHFSNEVNLKKCNKCILPESYPYIHFDSKGICNFCHRYERQKLKPKNELLELLDKHRNPKKDFDCLVGLSGGRDSCYALHILVKEYGMRPIAFCYDWLMTSNIARYNISLMAEQLGVEVVYRCGNYARQAKNINNNIKAFTKDPHLGLLPVVQAGDKEMYHFGRSLRKQLGLNLTVWGSGHQLEQREFFLGYLGINKHLKNNPRLYDYGLATKIKMAALYGWHILKRPGFINSSLVDNALAFYHSFVGKDDFLYLFEYHQWNEDHVNNTLYDVYGLLKDERYGVNQWRMDDVHTSFNNYIYYLVGGFSEFDDFRSNQIREGLISREEAIGLARQDNSLHMDSLEHFAQLVGVNLNEVLRQIDKIPKAYQMK
jgi:glutamine---fructose-6-phosphate transaminase (isomerizing)